MAIKIIDTYNGIEKCFVDSHFCKNQWNDYMDAYLPYARAMVEADCSEYDFDRQVFPVLNNVFNNKDKLALAHGQFIKLTDNVENKIRMEFMTEIDVVVVFYLGLGNGAGWAVNIDGVQHVLLGAEKIIELGWYGEKEMKGLIYHELGHILHDSKKTTTQEITSQKDKALWQLYTEGFAMYCEQLLCNDKSFYHQDKDGWLNWCIVNRAELFREYIRVIENNESHQKFFGDWCSYHGVSDIGYYLGCELVKKICRTMTFQDMFNLSMKSIELVLYECAD